MGIDLVSPGSDPGISKERSIVIGCGFQDASLPTEEHALFQPNAKLSESSWESVLQRNSDYTSYAPSAQTSGTSRSCRDRQQFALVWKTAGREGEEFTSPDTSPGILRSFVPAVQLSGRLITSTTVQIFSREFDVILLRHLIVWPENSQP